MVEIGLLNRDLSALLSRLGHMDELIVCDAGFPIPDDVRTVDLSIAKNQPGLIEVLKEVSRYFSVEKIVIADETMKTSPTMAANVKAVFEGKVESETISHTELKKRSRTVKGIIRTGEFTAFSNVLLVSGPGDRWYAERS